uniref:CLEC16A/TT9 C-terminal domain-containing protein n=1 Tax=Setaria digitata TaxID=48799 RepID=A0A915PI41_9BILA
MFRRLGSSSLWKPRNPHSLEYLKYLHGVLVKNEQVTENNRKLLVECLRAIAEILIWGDQNESSVFDLILLSLSFQVEDEAMRSFVRAHSRIYFCALSDSIAKQSIEIDHFIRSAENESSNRERLNVMIDDYLDYMHYLNDVLLIGDEKLSAVFIEVVFERLLGSLYLSSLGSIRLHPSTAILTPVSTLFFLSQFLLTVDDSQAVQTLLSSFFFGDTSVVHYQWIRNEATTWVLASAEVGDIESRAFFNGYLNALICSRNDHSTFFGLIFIYAVCQNKGARGEILEAVHFNSDVVDSSDHNFLNGLLDIITRSVEKDAFIRTITVELCCIVLRQLLLAMDASMDIQVECERRTEKVIAELVSLLTPSVYSEELFLEMFEDEFYNFERNRIQVGNISTDSSLLLPPPTTALSGVPLNKRVPCGNEEQIQANIQLFFHLRRFALDLRDEEESHLPISSRTDVFVEVNDCINLENSDLLACTIIMNEKSEKIHRFLVTDQAQLILVEPDNKRMGWAVVRFVGLLQDTQLTSDLEDSRALHIIVNNVSNRSQQNRAVYFSAKFLFDDHIRCMAAKQRLTKGRQLARQCKLDQICDLLGIARKTSTWRSNKNPFRIVKGCPPGSLRRQPQVSSLNSSRSSSGSLNIVPDDPKHSASPSGNKDWKVEDV